MESYQDRFWAKVDKSGDCWEWMGTKTTQGFGQIQVGRNVWVASRVAWELINGPIYEGAFVWHHCNNRGCVNPDHLYLASRVEKMTPVSDRFWSKVEKTESCWIWTGNKNRGVRAMFYRNGKKEWAARVAWEIENGPIPSGLYVLHHCDNPACVRHDHLFLGTQADNMRDMCNKGRQGNRGRRSARVQ